MVRRFVSNLVFCEYPLNDCLLRMTADPCVLEQLRSMQSCCIMHQVSIAVSYASQPLKLIGTIFCAIKLTSQGSVHSSFMKGLKEWVNARLEPTVTPPDPSHQALGCCITIDQSVSPGGSRPPGPRANSKLVSPRRLQPPQTPLSRLQVTNQQVMADYLLF